MAGPTYNATHDRCALKKAAETGMNSPRTPFSILGEDGIRALTNAFYDIMDQTPEFADLRRMHAQSLDPMKQKLAEYLIGWMGGPPLYLEKYGTVCMTDPHQNFAIGPKERDEWLQCFEKALDAISASEELRDMLDGPMFRLADTVRNRETSDSPLSDPNIIATSHRCRSNS